MSSDADDLLAVLEDEFLACYRRGENPVIDDFAGRHSHLAERIRDRLTAALALERARITSDEGPAPLAAGLPTIPNYDVLREVGRGGMGEVYEAVHLELQRHVALKVLQLGNLLDPRRVARFQQEARVVAGLQHANIVPVYDTGMAEGLHYYTMLFIRGASLDRIIDDLRRGAPDATDAAPPLPGLEGTSSTASGWPFFHSVARLGIQAATALQHAHDHGVLHRDIKPSNLMLDARSNVWLTDFGLARALDSDSDLSEAGAIPPGTLAYSPPERFEGRHDHRSDIFSLGLTLYELLSQRRANDALDPVQLLRQARDASPPPLGKLVARIPRDLETIVHKAIDSDPGRRYPSAGELAADLQRFLEDRPIRARRISALAHFGRRCRRHPVVTALTTLLLLAALGLLVFWGYTNQLLQARVESGERERALILDNQEKERLLHVERLEHAEQQRQQAQDQLHALTVRTATEFAARGNWPEALRAYDQAIADNRDDRLALEVARLRGLFAVNDWLKLERELERLRQLPLKGPQKAALRLAWGDFLFCDHARQREAEKAVKEALAARADLAPADAAYAEGLLAPKPGAKLRAFRRAIELAPSHLHHRANGALCTALLCLGRLDEARTEAAFMQRIYTEDALPPFLGAVLDLMEGERDKGLKKLEALAPKLGPERARQLRTLFTELGEVMVILERVNASFGAPDLGDLMTITGRSLKIGTLSGQAATPLGFGVPTVSILFQHFSLAAKAFMQLQFGSPENALKTLALEEEERPEGILLYLAVFCHAVQWQRAHVGRDEVRARALLKKVAELGQQAQTAPTVLPRLSFRYQALVLGTLAEATLVHDHKVSDPVVVARLRHNLQRLVNEGRAYPQMRGQIVPLLIPALEPELARFLLANWQLEDPTDGTVLLLRANLELRDGNHNAALKLAGARLKQKPEDKAWKKVHDEALAGLRKTLAEVPTP